MTADLLLAVAGLTVQLDGAAARQRVIDDFSLDIRRGETVALVGESGSGKSLTALSIMRLLPQGVRMAEGAIRFDGVDLAGLDDKRMNALRGGRIGMLFQQPRAMLDPTCRIGDQVAEPLIRHRGLSRRTARARAVELLRDMGIADAAARAGGYAHALSGGMAQRVMIAAALAADPDLLIADEPTTALDVTVQAQILRLLDAQRRARGMAILLISHDLAVVAAFAERVAVMYAGRIVETGPTGRILRAPRHPYTHALLRCSAMRAEANGALAVIPGFAAAAGDRHGGCRYLPRCETALTHGLAARCEREEPALTAVREGGFARCWAVGEDVIGTR